MIIPKIQPNTPITAEHNQIISAITPKAKISFINTPYNKYK